MLIYQYSTKTTRLINPTCLIKDMAHIMQEMDANGEPVTPDNLKLRGFETADIFNYGLDAARLAKKLSVKVARA